MFCPKCKSPDTQVYDTRVNNNGKSIKRRRECNLCKYRFTTFEELKVIDMYVRKRNGQEVQFNRDKLQSSILKAFNKRKVDLHRIKVITDEIIEELITSKDEVTSSEDIGNIVLNHLRDVDQAAYICFMAMFKNFDTAQDFIQLVKQFENNYD
jgi:transcriptional repressor NrdR